MSGKSKTGKPRRNPGVRGPRPDRKELRKDAANDRRVARDNRTDGEQIDRLDRKLGKGQGAKKERVRLAAKMRKERRA